jgi:hypothetical protein
VSVERIVIQARKAPIPTPYAAPPEVVDERFVTTCNGARYEAASRLAPTGDREGTGFAAVSQLEGE